MSRVFEAMPLGNIFSPNIFFVGKEENVDLHMFEQSKIKILYFFFFVGIFQGRIRELFATIFQEEEQLSQNSPTNANPFKAYRLRDGSFQKW